MPVRRSVILQVNLLDECPYRVIIGRETSEKNEDREAFNTTSSGWYYDRDNRMVHIKFGKASSEETNVQIIMHR